MTNRLAREKARLERREQKRMQKKLNTSTASPGEDLSGERRTQPVDQVHARRNNRAKTSGNIIRHVRIIAPNNKPTGEVKEPIRKLAGKKYARRDEPQHKEGSERPTTTHTPPSQHPPSNEANAQTAAGSARRRISNRSVPLSPAPIKLIPVKRSLESRIRRVTIKRSARSIREENTADEKVERPNRRLERLLDREGDRRRLFRGLAGFDSDPVPCSAFDSLSSSSTITPSGRSQPSSLSGSPSSDKQRGEQGEREREREQGIHPEQISPLTGGAYKRLSLDNRVRETKAAKKKKIEKEEQKREIEDSVRALFKQPLDINNGHDHGHDHGSNDHSGRRQH